ncbi:amidase family protein [Limibaculum sp. FT325]|uniref:amidase n=1 Tax=Thermohalobaculum sediminis TaxID=2939436 RepID=UPI0020BFE371|nr:amidase family protein [Limibaculum sediminis]MCL5776495.1 amidase family protein [Limibaculum sediminis]
MSAADLARGIRACRIDPVELAETFLAAIGSHEHGARIYARLTTERAFGEALAARGRAQAGHPLGPLDGVPVSWKDLFDTAGVATEAGSKLLEGRTPTHDAEVVRRGAAAGLVCLGKTHLSELAFSGLGVNPVTATPPNIHDPALAPGGSSSGAAVSVAAGLAAIGFGSDTGGSVRIPAAWNDLVGLKTTWGLIPCEGAVPLARSLDTVGPLCRTVEDAALAFGVLAGVPAPQVEGLEPAEVALVEPEALVLDTADAAVAAGHADALGRLGRAGVRIARASVPQLAECLDIAARLSAIVNFEGWAEWGPTIEAQPGVMFPMIEARFRTGASITPEADRAARAALAPLKAAVHALIAERGFLVMPTSAILPPPVERLMADDDYYIARNLLALRNTRLGNLLDCTALTLPTGTPMVGLMLVGRPGDEARLLRAGRVIERALS